MTNALHFKIYCLQGKKIGQKGANFEILGLYQVRLLKIAFNPSQLAFSGLEFN